MPLELRSNFETRIDENGKPYTVMISEEYVEIEDVIGTQVNDLLGVIITSPIDGDALIYTGGTWSNGTVVGGNGLSQQQVLALTSFRI